MPRASTAASTTPMPAGRDAACGRRAATARRGSRKAAKVRCRSLSISSSAPTRSPIDATRLPRHGRSYGMRRRELMVGAGAAVICWPCATRAQQPAVAVIGFLSSRSPEDSVPQVGGFRQGLAEMSYVEGDNLAIEYRWARGDYERLPALAADLVG